MEEDFIPPQARPDQTGRSDLERRLRRAMGEGALNHGWIIAGPKGAGKATLAYRIARAVLDPAALRDQESFEFPADARTFRLIAANAHPDLFVAERLWDEKKEKHQTEITVETIRRLTSFLNKTASSGGARVAIVDTADDMNRNAANALLKVLEEPPTGALLLLLSASPGRLLPTLRSRCRRIDLAPLSNGEIVAFLLREGVSADDAGNVAAHARGRPGYALQLALGDGGEAIRLAQAFLETAQSSGDLTRIIVGVSGKSEEGRWPVFRDTLLASLSDAARVAAAGADATGFRGAHAGELLDAWQRLTQLANRGEAVNLDRGQMLVAMAHDLRDSLHRKTA